MMPWPSPGEFTHVRSIDQQDDEGSIDIIEQFDKLRFTNTIDDESFAINTV